MSKTINICLQEYYLMPLCTLGWKCTTQSGDAVTEYFFFIVFCFVLLYFLFKFFYYIIFYFTVLYWFCHTSTWIRHRYTCVPHPRFDACYWMLGAGTLGRPRGMVQGGRRERGSGWGMHVYLWRIHVDVWQNQYSIVK